MDRRIASRLPAHPEWIGRARQNLARWLETASNNARPTLLEWQAILDGPFEDLIEGLIGDDERCRRLRQSSPFCGMISREERTQILLDSEES